MKGYTQLLLVILCKKYQVYFLLYYLLHTTYILFLLRHFYLYFRPPNPTQPQPPPNPNPNPHDYGYYRVILVGHDEHSLDDNVERLVQMGIDTSIARTMLVQYVRDDHLYLYKVFHYSGCDFVLYFYFWFTITYSSRTVIPTAGK